MPKDSKPKDWWRDSNGFEDSKPKDWWREVKQLSGQQSTRPDLRSMIRFDVKP